MRASFPLVSIIMPVYNAEKYIKQAIDSILQQSYPMFELLILDDASSDHSMELVREYTDRRIVLFPAEKKTGLANLLNKGILYAKGEYIARMDADDISLAHRIQTQVDYLSAHPEIDLCSGAMQLFGQRETIWRRTSDTEMCKFTALFYSPVLHASSMWRKKSFDALHYDQTFFPAEDYALWTNALLCGKKLTNLPDVLYLYRIHHSQVNATSELKVEKTREVRKKYINDVFPNADKSFLQQLLNFEQLISGHPYNVLHLFDQMIAYNRQTHYFTNLKKTAVHFYQNIVFDYLMHNDFQWQLFFQMRCRQQVKWLFQSLKFFHIKQL